MFIYIHSRPNFKQCHVGFTTRSIGQILEYLCVCSRWHSIDSIFMQDCRIFKKIYRPELNWCYIGSKTMSLGQIFEKQCVHFGRYSFGPVFINPCQPLEKDKEESGSCRVKTRSLGQMLDKACLHSRWHTCSCDPIFIELCQNIGTMKSRKNLKLVYVGSKSRSLGQIVAKPFIHSKSLKSFIPIFIKLF